MLNSTSAALNKAVLSLLASDPELVALIGAGKVFDRPPQSASFPYISLGETEARNWSTQTSEGLEHRLILHAWSREPGQLQAQQMISRMHELLELADVPVEGNKLVNLRVIFWTVLPLGDGLTMHGIIRLRAVSEPLL